MKYKVQHSVLFLFLAVFHVAPFSVNGEALQPSEPDELVLAIHPYLSALELHKRYKPLILYLEGKTGKSIRVEISSNYETHVQNVGEGRVDFAFVGPAPYVRMTEKYDSKIILAGMEVNGSPFFHGVIIVSKDSPITSLENLDNKKFAFTDRNSTMGYMVPKGMLKEAGVSEESLARTGFLGSHNNVALAVLGGYFEAGAVKEEVYHDFQKRGVRMLAKTPPVPEHLFVANPKLSPRLVETLRAALLGLKDAPGGMAILKSIKESTTALVSVEDSDFDILRKILSSQEE